MKKLKLLLLLTAMGAALASGCSAKKSVKNSEELLTKMQETSKNYKSAEMDIKMSISSEGGEKAAGATEFSIDIDGTSSVILKPQTVKMEGTMKMKAAGQEHETPLKVYTEKEDNGKYTTYTYDKNAGWYKMTTDMAEYDYSSMIDYKALKDLSSDFKISKDSVKKDNTECYELTGKLTGDTLKSLYSNYKSLGITDNNLEDYSIDLTILIDKDNFKTKSMNLKLGTTEKSEIKLSCNVDINFKSYDSVKSIEVPEEAKKAQDMSSLIK
ncbi:DUF6612 family protein [Anaerosacchariphilus polymeriproducens]|uniref:Lipoprotein n=1 Tax=Anaerosacchariphilus polymeriproducens TaxID=1812858 RepID=A0A371AUX0_9FIRM|nr:DUF6612 family protein [Anaerosacchariphilus polymeriproducens]RDU23365.1 hypothetical protein DWV06_09935 [Anaerosacchariphilus polymeriproducens]